MKLMQFPNLNETFVHHRISMLHLSWLIAIVLLTIARAPQARAEAKYDLSQDKVLYCVGYAHLDTQWRWDFCTTIDKYIKATLDENFALFEQFPGYVFNFTGSVRYEMMKEYYPGKYEELKIHIAAGRWFVSGSSVDEGDVNVPSSEAIIRQVLYGNDFFRREFGQESVDFMLPDCFGFPASLPSIWAHCGLKGFSTQKLTWGSAVGIPFKIGVWEGPDGKSIISALDPGPYVGAIEGRVDTNPEWVKRIEDNGRKYGVFADYHYYGVGDQGGAPRAEDVRNYLTSMGNPDSQINVALVASDQMFKDITDEQKEKLPRYKGDLLLTQHSAGTLSSQAYMKRWNRKNEQLADAAERAAVAAHWLGAANYPREKLNRSWVRLLANQMHDILPGTSIPRAYTFSWNDELVAMNGFAAVLENSVGAIARGLNTQVKGVPLIVYNPLSIEREDVVEATVVFKSAAPRALRILDPAGNEVLSQVQSVRGNELAVLFLARTPPLSWSTYDVQEALEKERRPSALHVSESKLENERYRVTINEDGDIASIVDKRAEDRELLAAPARLVFTHEKPEQWPAWNMDWQDRQRPPLEYVTGPARVRIVEEGPVRVALEIERHARNSIIRQTIRLAAGAAGERIEIANEVDWQSAECALRASFPLTVSNSLATYNWGLGTIERGNNEPTKYEVPSHEWFDLTDSSGKYGVSILEDCKYGSDKSSDNEVRLTLLYTPGVRSSYMDQHSQDWGRHEFTYAVYGHQGDWREGQSSWQARRLNQPLRAFQAIPHDGPLGRSFSLLKISHPQVSVQAVKLAEHSDEVIVRVQELWGQEARNVRLSFATPVAQAGEIDGQERRIGPATVEDGFLVFDLSPYSPKTFATRLAPPSVTKPQTNPISPKSMPVALTYDSDVITHDSAYADGAMDLSGRTIPAEMLPAEIVSEDIQFQLGPTANGQMNAMSCRGQMLELPEGNFNRLYFLAAADGDVDSHLMIGNRIVPWSVQSWTGFVGQWDDRIFDKQFGEVDHHCDGKVVGFKTGYVNRDTIAWFCTHRHDAVKGNEPYRFSYLYKYGFPLEGTQRSVRLPHDPRIKVLAATVALNENDSVRPAAPLYDDFTGRKPIELRHKYPPDAPPVYADTDPIASVVLDRRVAFTDLRMGPPSNDDFAGTSSGNGVLFQYIDRDGQQLPHRRSGAEGTNLPRLNDGDFAQNHDDTQRCVWWDGEGRFAADLKKSVAVSAVVTYSWHRSSRAPQYFSLWASNAPQMPDPHFASGKDSNWTLLAVVDTRELGEGGIHASSVEPSGGRSAIGTFRHLLWVLPAGQGTFFTEVDVHAAK